MNHLQNCVEVLDWVEEYELAPGIDIKTFHLKTSEVKMSFPEVVSCLICMDNIEMEEGKSLLKLLCCGVCLHKDCALDWLYLPSLQR